MTTTLMFQALAADDAWHYALIAAYKAAAGDARYDARGTATPILAALKAAKLAADRAYRADLDKVRL